MARVSKQQAPKIIELAILMEAKSGIIFRKRANIQARVSINLPKPNHFNIFRLSLVAYEKEKLNIRMQVKNYPRNKAEKWFLDLLVKIQTLKGFCFFEIDFTNIQIK